MWKAKKKLNKVLSVIAGLTSLFFAGLVSMNSSLVNQEAIYKHVAKTSETNDLGFSYATLCYSEEGQGKAVSAFVANYGRNFSGTSQAIPACLKSETNELKTFKAGLTKMGDVYIGNLINYTNQKKLRRFEMALINVYDQDAFNPHAYSADEDGFVFLPDFYADKLIAESNGVYKCYDDLLPDPTSTPLQCSFKYLTIEDGKTSRKWSIAGIYHAKGFKTEYLNETFEYNDGDFGKAINLFDAPFLIAYDSSFFENRLNGMALFSAPKQYSVEEQVKTFAAYDKSSGSTISFYTVKNECAKKMEDYSSISVACLFQSDSSPIYFLFMSLTIISIGFFFYLVRSLPYENPLLFLCHTALGPFTFSLFGSLIANFWGFQVPFLYRFFSYYFGAFTLIVLGIAAGFLVYDEKRKREAIDEK